MTAGELRDRVTIQQKTTTDDGQGGRSASWGTLATVWACIKPLRMSEQLQAAAIGAHQTYQVVIRYYAAVTPKMRIQWTPYQFDAAKTLEIHGVQPYQGGRAFMQLDCSEVI